MKSASSIIRISSVLVAVIALLLQPFVATAGGCCAERDSSGTVEQAPACPHCRPAADAVPVCCRDAATCETIPGETGSGSSGQCCGHCPCCAETPLVPPPRRDSPVRGDDCAPWQAAGVAAYTIGVAGSRTAPVDVFNNAITLQRRLARLCVWRN